MATPAVKVTISYVRTQNVEQLVAVITRNRDIREYVGRVWGVMYSSWTRQRFELYSKTGGVAFKRARGGSHNSASAGTISGERWPPLAESTLEGRRKEGKDAAILRNTGLLFAAVANLKAMITVSGGRVVVKFKMDSPARYPKGSASVGDIANFHQKGGPHLPRRIILAQIQQAPVSATQAGSLLRVGNSMSNPMSVLSGGDQPGSNWGGFVGSEILDDATGAALFKAMVEVGRDIYLNVMRAFLKQARDGSSILSDAPVQKSDFKSDGDSHISSIVSGANWKSIMGK